MGALRFASPFVFALSIPALYYFAGPLAPFLTVVALLTALIGAELIARREQGPEPQGHLFRVLPNLYVPIQLGVIVWAVIAARQSSTLGFVALALPVGVTTGVFGVLAAHELVHGHNRAERLLGLVMLTGMSYRHFRVAHIFGHHRYAATDRDAASARLGESFYVFLPRTVVAQFADAWSFEARRGQGRLAANRIARDVAVLLGLYAAIAIALGGRSAVFFGVQSVIGIVVLELFNYIAHYGLVRGTGQPFTAAHSWNSSNAVANALIFNMGRHSWHHARPAASFESLRFVPTAPELPAGYAGSILLALVPPLWRRVMDPAVQNLHTRGNATV